MALSVGCFLGVPYGAPQAAGPDLPALEATKSLEPHCAPLIEGLIARWNDTVRWQVSYVWKSPNGYLWDWEHNARADVSTHYCARLTLFGPGERIVEKLTLLCSVNSRGLSTEVWTAGNHDMTPRLCPTSDAMAALMDAHPVLFGRNVPKTRAAEAGRPNKSVPNKSVE